MKKIKDLSWKQKNRLAAAGLFIAGWLMYSAAISPTLELKATCDHLREQSDSAEKAPALVHELELKLQELNHLTGRYMSSDSAAHEHLLDLVTGYCEDHQLTLREFNSPVRYTQEEWKVETHPFTVEGSFTGIVQLLDYLREAVPGKIVSADIHSKKDNKSKTISLLVTIYVQNISNTST